MIILHTGPLFLLSPKQTYTIFSKFVKHQKCNFSSKSYNRPRLRTIEAKSLKQ